MRRVRSGSLSEPHAPPQPTLSRVALDPEAPQAYSSHVRLYKAAHRGSAATLHGMSGSRSMAGLLRPVSPCAPSAASNDAITAAALTSDDGADSATELGAGTGATTAPSMAAPATVQAAPSASAAASTGARNVVSSLATGPRLPLLRGREKLSLLRHSPLFSMMSEPALLELCGLAEEREMRKMQTCHPSRSIFVLVYVDA